MKNKIDELQNKINRELDEDFEDSPVKGLNKIRSQFDTN